MAVNLSPYGGVGAQFLDNSGNVLTGGKIYTYAAGTTTPQATYTSSNGAVPHPNPIILDAAGRVPGGEIWLTDGLVYKFILRDANDVLIATYDGLSGINSNFVAFTNQQEIQTATAGQTVFNLTTMSYQPGTNSLSVFVDGVNQYGPGAQYAYLETDSDTVTFVNGLHVGAEVKFTTSQLNSSVSQTNAFQISYVPPFSGSIPTNVGDKLSEYVSVKDFGAVGDGLADDTAAIQAAIAASSSIYFPSGTYLVSSTIQIQKVISCTGDATAVIKAAPGFTGISVTKNSLPFDLKAIFAFFTGNTIDTISGTRLGESAPCVEIGSILFDGSDVCDNAIYMERCLNSSIYAHTTNTVNGIFLGPYCWGTAFNNNDIVNFTNYGIYFDRGANGVVIQNAKIWGKNYTGTVGIYSKGNNNGVEISGGYVEKVSTGIYIHQDSGPHIISGVDIESIVQHCVFVDHTPGDPRVAGPVTVQGCYLDSTDSEIYNRNGRVISSGNRFRATSNSHYAGATDDSIFELDNNSYDTTNGVPIPENLSLTNSAYSTRITKNSLSLINKKVTPSSGAYSTNWGLYNYTSNDQPDLISSSLEFQNSRQGGPTLLWSSKSVWTVNETNTDPADQILYTGGVSIQSLGGARSFTPITTGTHSLGNPTFKWLTAHFSPYTVSSLPSASAQGVGARAFVSDATATTFGSVYSGGGANAVPVYSDGTNWRIG